MEWITKRAGIVDGYTNDTGIFENSMLIYYFIKHILAYNQDS